MVKTETATFGAGCFWSVQVIFDQTPGVLKTEVGYMGGDEYRFQNPTYEQICTDKTGYVEVLQVTFNPKEVSYQKLLDIFWSNHDPTTLNRQGPDIGTQYRSVIFYHSPKQKNIALKSKENYQKKIGNNKKIVTQITPASTFFKAEEYHQKYLEKRGLASCHI